MVESTSASSERSAYLQLTLAGGFGTAILARVVKAAGSAQKALGMSEAQLSGVERVGKSAGKLLGNLRQAQPKAAEVEKKCADLGILLLCPADENYPKLMLEMPDPPGILYVLGSFEPRDLNAMAVVGARACSTYGREQAERFGLNLATCGFTVVSGGARGVDSAAHRGALSEPNGRTIAVTGSGLDVPYPPENVPLFKQIAQRGAVISEYPPGTVPEKHNFPRRNRIISGLSRGVLLIEGDEFSGAMTTAKAAVEDHNRPVFALPGRIDNPLSAAPHKLIREGAVLVTCLEDLIAEIGPLPEAVRQADEHATAGVTGGLFDGETVNLPKKAAVPAEGPLPTAGMTESQQMICRVLKGTDLSADEIMQQTGLEASVVLRELTLLGIRAAVKRTENQRYTLRRSQGS